jgi:hypothetical protein
MCKLSHARMAATNQSQPSSQQPPRSPGRNHDSDTMAKTATNGAAHLHASTKKTATATLPVMATGAAGAPTDSFRPQGWTP